MGAAMAGMRNRITYLTRDGINIIVDSAGLKFLPDRISPKAYYVHPLKLNETFVSCHSSFSGPIKIKADYWFHRDTDDGQWEEIPIPSHSRGISREAFLNFDYSRPERLWVTIDGGYDGFGSYFEHDYHYSDDLGKSWVRVFHEIPTLMGMLKPDYGLLWKRRGNTIYSEPALYNPITGDSIPLGWYDALRAEFAKERNLNGWNFTLEGTIDTETNRIEGTWIHPENRNNILVTVYADSIGASRFTRFTHYLSKDRGETWSRIYEIKDVITGNRADILSTQAVVTADGSTVLIPGSRRRIDSTFEVLDLTFILRFSDEATSVAGESPEPTNDILHIYPNPASQGSDVTVAFSRDMSLGSDENVFVSCSTIDGRQATTSYKQSRSSKPQSTDCYTLSTSGLAPGVYIVQVQSRNRTDSKLLVVTH
ncbi:MAG: T9SS type A sorting domain-containing protein [Ignavibacteria bacterium]|nr:T9SS type A sorting domain-containing protein [Ignavibacteria bacterium]